MEILFIVMGASFAIIVGCLYNVYSKKNRVYELLLERFGTKPEYKEYDFDKIKLYWSGRENEKCQSEIDNITWNDLNMDKVFARINMCCSSIGEQYLYKSLRNISFEDCKMESLEEKIIYMDKNQNDRIKIQKKLLCIGKNVNNYYIPLFLRNLNSYKLNNIWFYYIFQAMLFIAIGLSIILQHIKSVFGIFKENLEVIKKLSQSMSLINGRHQKKYTADFMEMCALYITGAFLFDFVLYNRILTKLNNSLMVIFSLFGLIGELDMAISIASFRKSLSFYCLPEFCMNNRISYSAIYNPLVDKPVCNDFGLNNNCIITGSNASGKSTFIKAIAINEILAMSIHTCTAKRAIISKAEIYTSMAIRDDLLAGESYFVKEIKSLHRIIKVIDQGRFSIAIIDEILRGTNTKERISASAAILKYLENKNCIVVVASHDIELINLLKSNRYDNYYFCEKADKEDVIFDYKIHRGICEQSNAIKLLEFFGFPGDIVKKANKYSDVCL